MKVKAELGVTERTVLWREIRKRSLLQFSLTTLLKIQRV